MTKLAHTHFPANQQVAESFYKDKVKKYMRDKDDE